MYFDDIFKRINNNVSSLDTTLDTNELLNLRKSIDTNFLFNVNTMINDFQKSMKIKFLKDCCLTKACDPNEKFALSQISIIPNDIVNFLELSCYVSRKNNSSLLLKHDYLTFSLSIFDEAFDSFKKFYLNYRRIILLLLKDLMHLGSVSYIIGTNIKQNNFSNYKNYSLFIDNLLINNCQVNNIYFDCILPRNFISTNSNVLNKFSILAILMDCCYHYCLNRKDMDRILEYYSKYTEIYKK